VMVDCSHANSNKDYTRQAVVCRDVAQQIENGSRDIFGVMLESNLVAGAQKFAEGRPLVYGQSITDGCMGWDETLVLLRELAAAVRSGR
jgi:3-deoxy-7-phosphoheptulonate synthase